MMRTEIYIDIVDLICPVCGKGFVPAAEHVYRTDDGKPVCSWHCLCDYRRRRSKTHGARAVLQLDARGGVVKEWKSARDAALVCGIDPANIRACCNGKYQLSGGYRWIWKTDATSDTLYGSILQSNTEAGEQR